MSKRPLEPLKPSEQLRNVRPNVNLCTPGEIKRVQEEIFNDIDNWQVPYLRIPYLFYTGETNGR